MEKDPAIKVSDGYSQLENSLTILHQINENCVKTLTDFQSSLWRSEDDDKTLNQAYGYQWRRVKSAAINKEFKVQTKKYSQKL